MPDEEYAMEHGYNFEVPTRLTGGPVEPVPLKAMGRFYHEAVAVDPKTGIVYQTEDRPDSLVYRFLPTEPGRDGKAGNLAAGGTLQALRVRGHKSFDTRNWRKLMVTPGQALDVEWVDLEDVESPDDDLRFAGFFLKGCARFARGEGMWHGRDGIYIASTTGGPKKRGQIWRYTPSAHEGTSEEASDSGKLELFVEPNDHNICENCDNLTMAPWGDLFVCEDQAAKRNIPEQYILRITPEGKVSRFARNALNRSEIAGVTFSPDGSTLFANLYNPGITVAITGPWRDEIPPLR
jgi:secreted PhoX family phosphatase